MQAEIVGVLQTDRFASRTTVRRLLGDATPEVRQAALWAFGFVGDDVEDFDLLATAAADSDPQVRTLAIGSLASPAGNDRAFDVFVQALRDPDEHVRVVAASRLGFSGRPDAVIPLASTATDRAAHVRALVAYGLGQLASTSTVPTLVRLLADEDPDVRSRAVEASAASAARLPSMP